jgi:hypothetical protein
MNYLILRKELFWELDSLIGIAVGIEKITFNIIENGNMLDIS